MEHNRSTRGPKWATQHPVTFISLDDSSSSPRRPMPPQLLARAKEDKEKCHSAEHVLRHFEIRHKEVERRRQQQQERKRKRVQEHLELVQHVKENKASHAELARQALEAALGEAAQRRARIQAEKIAKASTAMVTKRLQLVEDERSKELFRAQQNRLSRAARRRHTWQAGRIKATAQQNSHARDVADKIALIPAQLKLESHLKHTAAAARRRSWEDLRVKTAQREMDKVDRAQMRQEFLQVETLENHMRKLTNALHGRHAHLRRKTAHARAQTQKVQRTRALQQSRAEEKLQRNQEKHFGAHMRRASLEDVRKQAACKEIKKVERVRATKQRSLQRLQNKHEDKLETAAARREEAEQQRLEALRQHHARVQEARAQIHI